MAELDTRQRLLLAAAEIFAQKGYTQTRIAEICARAEANIALVNYHFGDKRSLYNCVWRYAFKQARAEFPIDGGIPAEASPAERLKAAIRAILGRIFSKSAAGVFPRLLLHEMATPSGSLQSIADEAIRPQLEYVAEIVRELLGDAADELAVRDCSASTLSQCFMLNCGQGLAAKVFVEQPPTELDLESTTEHIFTFSMAGIKAVKRRLQSR
jgi:TetR/AcrR family transcriptional regulator, regulator of cefoperazone and chloramphenicol sensitivity